MSRCFPFPPPGYELKARPDDIDLIIKDKEKHKKHKDKKDRKDKEKKERSERKEKERSEDKHKEDKKRKRKEHRDKKDKSKDKEKESVEFLDNQNGQKPDSKATNGFHDKGAIVELGNRVSNNGGATSNHLVHKITIGERENIELLGKVQENGNGTLATQDKRDHSKMANGQSLSVDPRSLGNGHIRNSHGENQVKVEVNSSQAGKMKERNGYGNIVGEGDGSKNGDQFKNKKVEDTKRKKENDKQLMGFSKEKVRHEKNGSNSLDFHSKIPPDHPSKSCQGKLPKLKELNDVVHAKDNGVWHGNMSRPALVSHQAGQTTGGSLPSQNTINLGVGKRGVITDQKGNGKLTSPQSVIDSARNIELVSHQAGQTAGGSLPSQSTINLGVGKRGVITDQKGNGKLTSPQSVIDSARNIEPCQTANAIKTENGRVNVNNRVVSNGVISPHIIRIERKMEPCQTSNGVAMVKQIANHSTNGKIPSSHPSAENGGKMAMEAPEASLNMMHNKQPRVNGSLEVKKSASLKGKEKVATTKKPPHPDSTYLSRILTLPEVESPQCADQDWLFNHKDSRTKRPKLASSETKQVWSQAVELESADITALPYVIPY